MRFFRILRSARCTTSSAWLHLTRPQEEPVKEVFPDLAEEPAREAFLDLQEEPAREAFLDLVVERAANFTALRMEVRPITPQATWAIWVIWATFLKICSAEASGKEAEQRSIHPLEVPEERREGAGLQVHRQRREGAGLQVHRLRRAGARLPGLPQRKPAIGPLQFGFRLSRHALAAKLRSTREAVVSW